jgi:hypothetical protein
VAASAAAPRVPVPAAVGESQYCARPGPRSQSVTAVTTPARPGSPNLDLLRVGSHWRIPEHIHCYGLAARLDRWCLRLRTSNTDVGDVPAVIGVADDNQCEWNEQLACRAQFSAGGRGRRVSLAQCRFAQVVWLGTSIALRHN